MHAHPDARVGLQEPRIRPHFDLGARVELACGRHSSKTIVISRIWSVAAGRLPVKLPVEPASNLGRECLVAGEPPKERGTGVATMPHS